MAIYAHCSNVPGLSDDNESISLERLDNYEGKPYAFVKADKIRFPCLRCTTTSPEYGLGCRSPRDPQSCKG